MKNIDNSSSEHELAMLFGRNVQLLRSSQSLRKYVLAEFAGISRPHLNSIEKGLADVRLSTVQSLAEVLSVDPADLLKSHESDES